MPGTSAQLSLAVGEDVPAETALIFALSAEEGIVLPAEGVRADAPEVTLASNAFSGPVLPTPVAAVMVIEPRRNPYLPPNPEPQTLNP